MRLQLLKDRALFAYLGLYAEAREGGGLRRGLFRQPSHGPQIWPWWRLFAVKAYRANPDIPFSQAPVRHWNVWFYSRWGAFVVDAGVDYRTPQQLGRA